MADDGVSIQVDHLKKVYSGNPKSLTVFDNLSLSFQRNSITAILGPSGCGKSTLLRLIAGLEMPTAGDIIFSSDKHRVGMVFQEYTAFPWRTVSENISFGLELGKIPKEEHKEIIDFWLDKVGLFEFKNYYPAQLSGGMKQRLAFARCLAVQPDIILMDEPFGALDSFSRDEMVGFAEQILTFAEKTTIFVTHNIKEAIQMSDRIVVLSTIPSRKLLNKNITLQRPRSYKMLWQKEILNIEEEIRASLR